MDARAPAVAAARDRSAACLARITRAAVTSASARGTPVSSLSVHARARKSRARRGSRPDWAGSPAHASARGLPSSAADRRACVSPDSPARSPTTSVAMRRASCGAAPARRGGTRSSTRSARSSEGDAWRPARRPRARESRVLPRASPPCATRRPPPLRSAGAMSPAAGRGGQTSTARTASTTRRLMAGPPGAAGVGRAVASPDRMLKDMVKWKLQPAVFLLDKGVD